MRSFGRFFCVFTAILMFGVKAIPAQHTDLQTKAVTHITYDLGSNWFLAGWQISNIRRSSPGNFNLMTGLGYRKGKNWVEVMAQRQWGKRNFWFVDTRLQLQLAEKSSLFVEIAPWIGEPRTFTFAALDFKPSVASRFSYGVESENILKSTKSLYGLGPRVGYVITRGKHSRLTATQAYQFRFKDPNFARFYLASSIFF